MNPATFLRALGPQPWNVAYVEPSLRPTDGRYGENPYRLQHYYQFQVLLKPVAGRRAGALPRLAARRSASTRARTTSASSRTTGRRPTLGAWGLGWEVWLRRHGDHAVHLLPAGRRHRPATPVSVEITYGLERIAMYLQGVDNVYDLRVGAGRHLRRRATAGTSASSRRTTSRRPTSTCCSRHFDDHEREASALMERGLPLPAYDQVLKCSHTFNLLDARGAISVTERVGYIARVRNLARAVAAAYVESLEPA